MEKSPDYSQVPPEFAANSIITQLALLHKIRMAHTRELTRLGTIEKARTLLPKAVSTLFTGAVVAPAVSVETPLPTHIGRSVYDPPLRQEGIRFAVSRLSSEGQWRVSPHFAAVGLEEDGTCSPIHDGATTFSEREIDTLHYFVEELRDAKSAGLLPDLSDDLTDIEV